MGTMTAYWTHSLHKQIHAIPDGSPIDHLRILHGEVGSAQLLIANSPMHTLVTATVESRLNARLRRVATVPVRMTALDNADEWYLSKEPGLYPDMLEDMHPFWVHTGRTETLWLDVRADESVPTGDYPVTVRLATADETTEYTLNVTVLAETLPKQTVCSTMWFHSDCLADYYRVPVFSEEYWTITERFMRALAETGITMILTPIFTPPLDTEIGHERTTVQLTDVTVQPDGTYTFGFDRLKRWIDTAQRCGLTDFEMAHLFTQWGAQAAPKVVAHTPDGDRRIFGWDTPADGDAYQNFLAAFLPTLTAQLRAWGIAERCRFHLSDEPSEPHLPHYLALKQRIAPYLKGFVLMDALSRYEFYEQGAVDQPVVSLNHVQPFLDHGMKPLWVYYCCGQGDCCVSNRFMTMPSLRNRVLGFQMYLHGAVGFLQWGFNFYNSSRSLYPINPFYVTDADGAFPSGDAFVVYPGADGSPIGSIRQMVFAEAMQDYRLCECVAAKIGAERVRELIRTGGVRSFFDCDHAPERLLALREKLLDQLI